MKWRVLLTFCAVAVFFLLWHTIYPDYYDPKSISYIGWKMHLLPMDPRRALNIMTHGLNSDRLVLGRTTRELQQRFGYVQTIDHVSPYLRDYCAAARPGADVLFLNSSNWMVVMQNDHVVELVLCKG